MASKQRSSGAHREHTTPLCDIYRAIYGSISYIRSRSVQRSLVCVSSRVFEILTGFTITGLVYQTHPHQPARTPPGAVLDALLRLSLGAGASARSHEHNRSTWERGNGGEFTVAAVFRPDCTHIDSNIAALSTFTYIPLHNSSTNASQSPVSSSKATTDKGSLRM